MVTIPCLIGGGGGGGGIRAFHVFFFLGGGGRGVRLLLDFLDLIIDMFAFWLLVLLYQYLDDFNMSSSKEMKLVFFLDAVQHIAR